MTDPRPLLAHTLASDPRVEQARQLLRAAHADHTGACRGVRAADPDRAAESAVLLQRLADARGAPTWYPYLGSGVGHGPLVELLDGSIKYDCISGIGVHGLGHGNPALLEAGIDAALGDVVMQGHLQQNAEGLAVSEALLALAKAGGLPTNRVLLTTSGAMANENALKIAYQARATAVGNSPRLLAFGGNFAGRSLALAAVSDKPRYRDGLPLALTVDYLPYPRAGTPHRAAALRHLDRILSRYPNQHAALMLEPVQGEGGFYPPDPETMLAIIARCRAAGVLIIADEIQTFGRLPNGPFAVSHFGFAAAVDVVTVGKQSQICATLFRADLQPRPGLVSQTFTGGSHALLASERILGLMHSGDWFGHDGRIARLSEHFRNGLRDLAPGPYGVGGMLACTPYAGDPAAVQALCRRLFDHGVIAFIAGGAPTRLRFLPPLPVMTETHIDDILAILASCLTSE